MHQDPELTKLRAQKRETEHLLAALDDFERRWDEFAGMLEHVVKLCAESGLSIWSTGVVEAALKKADELRIDLASRQQEVLPAYRDPLAKFLRTSVRAYSGDLWELLGEFMYDGGQMLLPMDDDGDSIYSVNVKRFEINVGEAKGEIARRRLELRTQLRQHATLLDEAQQAIREAHARDMEIAKAQAASAWRNQWQNFKAGLGRVAWWFVEEPLRNLLWLVAVIVIFALMPSSRRWVASAWSWLSQHADTTAHAPAAPPRRK